MDLHLHLRETIDSTWAVDSVSYDKHTRWSQTLFDGHLANAFKYLAGAVQKTGQKFTFDCGDITIRTPISMVELVDELNFYLADYADRYGEMGEPEWEEAWDTHPLAAVQELATRYSDYQGIGTAEKVEN